MPTTTRTVFLTDENGNPLIDEQRNMRTLSFSLVQGFSYRLVERASIVSATYAQVVGYSTATGQTIAGVENASEFDVGDFGIVQYAISDRNNTIGYVTCKVTAVGTDSLTVNGIGISVAGADGADGKDGAPGADGKDGAATVQIGTVTTGAAGSQASVTNVGADNAAILNFTIPRGDTGAQGVPGPTGAPGADGQDGATFTPSVDTNGNLSWTNDGNLPNPETVNLRGAQGEAATIQVGQVTTGAAGSEAVVTNVGTANAAILNFTIPRGAQGERGIQGETGTAGKDGADGADGAAATVTVGQVITLPAGSQATVTNSGNENAAVFNFGIPQGATGQTGANGQDGQDGVGIQTIAADGQDENGGNIYRITLTNGQSYTFVAPKGATGNTGATGATGAPGKDFRIYKTYASIAAMNADAENVPDGEFVSIASDENDPDNGRVYQRSADGEADFVFIFDLSGAQGIQGEAATIQIGQVLTGEPGTNASVENVGTENEAILNFTIPRGATGAAGRDGVNGADGKDGVNGQDGAAATIQIGEVITGAPGTNASVENTGTENAAILKITIPRGNAGAQGVQGEPGQKGADGKDGADGAPGAAATIQIGTVTTGAAGSQAAVTNTGTANAAILNFTIPRGNTGPQGNPGNDGAPGADGASGVTDVTAGSPTEQNGYTVTPVTFNFEQGNSKTVNIQAKNGEGAGVQQNAVINRTASVTTADENSPDFVENGGDLWVKRIAGYGTKAPTATTLEAALPSGGVYDSAATAPNGKIYVFDGGSTKRIVEFDPVTQSVTTLEATLPSVRSSTSAATAPNGKIYVFGGYATGYNLDEIVEFDPVAQTVTTLEATLPSARDNTSAATAPNGKIYVFGGGRSLTSTLDDIVEFDPVTQSVTTLEATLPRARDSAPAATAPNGKIYVFGGEGGAGDIDDIVEFDPVTQSVTTLEATLPSVRSSASAATAPNGKIYVFGGHTGGVSGYLDEIIEFDPVAQTATTTEAPLPSARYDTSAATAPNGKIYVFGGYSNRRHDDIVELDFVAPAQYAYSPAVVLSQEEYTQFKNILNGTFSVGISAPSAAIIGTLEAGNTTVNGTLTATGDISTVGGATIGADLSVMGNASAQNVTASDAVTADSAEISGAVSANSAEINGVLSARNTTVNGTLTATGKITAPSAAVNGELTADSAEVSGALSAGNTTVGTLSASGTVTASSFNATT